jgi:hypothetical protein
VQILHGIGLLTLGANNNNWVLKIQNFTKTAISHAFNKKTYVLEASTNEFKDKLRPALKSISYASSEFIHNKKQQKIAWAGAGTLTHIPNSAQVCAHVLISVFASRGGVGAM